jgi:hypothetical protein
MAAHRAGGGELISANGAGGVELMDETRPIVVSNLLAALLGATWIVLVYTMPQSAPTIALIRPEEAAAVEVQFEDEKPAKPAPPPEPAPVAATDKKEPTPAELKKAKKEEQAMADAFGGGRTNLVGDVTNALRGVNTAKGGKADEGSGKAVIAYGGGGTSVRTPGRGVDANVTAAGAGIGTVNGAGSVARVSIALSAPSVVRSADGGASGRDMAKLGTFVRARQAQLQYCYLDHGLAVNPNLAGSVSVTISMDAAGAVSDAKVASRTWSGGGVAEAESCILQRVKGWAFPPSAKSGTESYSFAFVFNR